MAQSSVRNADSFIQYARPEESKSPAPEILLSIEHLHQRFDEAYDRAENLGQLIARRRADGVDCGMLMGQLRAAESEKKSLLAELRKARWMKAVPTA